MYRLFFAVAFKEKDKLINLLRETKKMFPTTEKIKWVEEYHLHLTLAFVGEVEEIIAKQMIHECNKQFVKLESISLQYSSNFIFYHNRIPRVIGIQFKEHNTLTQLKGNLTKVLQKYAITEEERKFIPHITFGRVKEVKNLHAFNKFEQIRFSLDTVSLSTFALYQSILTNSGPIYQSLWEIKA